MSAIKKEQLKQRMAQKLKLTGTGYEATLKADTVEDVVDLCILADAKVQAYRTNGVLAVGTEAERDALLPLITKKTDQGVSGMLAAGQAGAYNEDVQEADDFGFRVKQIRNTKGIGWEIGVNCAPDVESMVFLAAEVKKRLIAAFPEAAGQGT